MKLFLRAFLIFSCLTGVVNAEEKYWKCAKANLVAEHTLEQQADNLIKAFSQGGKKTISRELARAVVDDVYLPIIDQFEPRLKKAHAAIMDEAYEVMSAEHRHRFQSNENPCEWLELINVNPEEIALPYDLRENLASRDLSLQAKMELLAMYMIDSGGISDVSQEDAEQFAEEFAVVMTAMLEAMPKHFYPIMQDVAKAFERKMTAFNKPNSVKEFMKAVGQ